MKLLHPRWLSFLSIILLACALGIASGDAWARSGGSFGGGFRSSSRSFGGSSSRSFGSSSSRSFFGSSGSSSSSSPSYGGTRYIPVPVPVGYSRPYYSYSYWNHGRSYGSSGLGSALAIILFFIILIVVIVVLKKLWQRGRDALGEASQARAEQCDVTLIQLGVQMQAREIQDHLEKLADKVDATSEEGLAYALRTLAQDLIAHQENVEYGAVQVQSKMALAKAQDQFELWASNERAKYNREVIRGQAGGARRQEKEWKTDGLRDEDGQFAVAEFFVVSLVLASRGLQLESSLVDQQALQRLLEQLAGLRTEQLVALEVVWSPAAQSDSMSRDDMTSRYPNMSTI